MKKNDLIIIIAGLLLTVSAWFLISRPGKGVTGGEAVIYKDGKENSVVPLDENRIITVKGENGTVNVIQIEDGKVKMAEANCPDQICVHTRPAEKDGQSIVCLPNRVVVEVISTKKETIDGVSE